MVNAAEKGVVAVTRNGEGDFWWFPDWKTAYTHPLIQYGDVICEGPDFIEKNWTRREFPWLLSVLVSPVERSEILVDFKSKGWDNWLRTLDRYRGLLWQKMLDKCQELPTDADTIFATIKRDRLAPNLETRKMAKDPKSTEAATVTETSAGQIVSDAAPASGDAAPAAEKGTTKRQPPVREPKYKNDSIITLLADKDGNPYGKDNNPKRAGSKSAERFAFYTNGMTVEQAIAAGLTRGDLDFDMQKNFISIAAPKA